MRLTIEIPEQMYQNAKKDMLCGSEIIVNAIKNGIPLEQEPKTKALGEELRSVRNGIKDENVLIGYNMAVAICNKYLEVSK